MATQLSAYTVQVPAGTEGAAHCRSNASYKQRIKLTWKAQYDGVETQKTRTFEGTGEGMRLDTNTGETECVFHPRSDNAPYTVSISFEYSSNNGVTWLVPMVTGPTIEKDQNGRVARIDFTTEDATDGDSNDTCLTILFKYL